MNINKTKKSGKRLYIIAFFLILSLILNGVLYKNLYAKEAVSSNEFYKELKEKETNIKALQSEIQGLQDEIKSLDPQERKELSKTELELQEAFKTVANEFITDYLTYSTNTINERREKLMPITSAELLNQVAPESMDNDPSQLSSDPTFSVKVSNVILYISGFDSSTDQTKMIGDVTYKTQGTEGKTTEHSLVEMELMKDKKGQIKVNNYTYYPIN
ncbi:hypothetical protein [Niallia sp. MER 6]|uniref:hypothetical protein n=1 Tax=Niallia sp. MER 6 TaxID=2939567 RepID=UPI00203EAB72|nr:hypothetical protein [Niallia sp. MER 6]MCM3033700.1 hypothetical protein [Niallia sp. MER 6]